MEIEPGRGSAGRPTERRTQRLEENSFQQKGPWNEDMAPSPWHQLLRDVEKVYEERKSERDKLPTDN